MSHFKYFCVGIVAAIICVTFQNCAKGAAGSSDDGNQEAQFLRSEAAGFSILNVNERAVLAPLDVNTSNKPVDYRHLKIDLIASTVSPTDSRGVVIGSAVPLSTEDKDNLTQILAESEICEPVPLPANNEMACTMIYKYPYVELVNGSEVKRLGEQRNGCDRGIDLCDQKNDELKAYLRDILDKI